MKCYMLKQLLNARFGITFSKHKPYLFSISWWKLQYVKWCVGKCRHRCYCCKYRHTCMNDGDWWLK